LAVILIATLLVNEVLRSCFMHQVPWLAMVAGTEVMKPVQLS